MRKDTLFHHVGVAGLIAIVVASCSGKQEIAHPASTGGAGVAGTAALAAGGGASGSSSTGAGRGAAGGSEQTSTAGRGGTSGGGGRDSTGGTGARGAAGTSPMTESSGQGGGDAGHAGAGGQAGTTGGAGSGSENCAQLEQDYADALHMAKMCDVRSSQPCPQVVASKLGCYCMTHVTDATSLNAIKARYEQAGCPMATCPGIACVNPGTGVCMGINSGDFCD